MSEAAPDWSSIPAPVDDGGAAHLPGKRVIDDGTIAHLFYPVFPPDRNAEDVLSWLRAAR